MNLERAAKFGLIAASGVIVISLGAVWLMQIAAAEAIRRGDATGTMLIVAIVGTAVSLLFLFTVIGEYVDRMLEARGIDAPES